jgi:tetratricopeptide (TPR) repeat protein
MAHETNQNTVCGSCNATVPEKAAFCPGCGAGVGSTAPPTSSRAPAIAVFLGFVAASAVGFYLVRPSGEPPKRAVPGSPSAAAPSAAGTVSGDLPGGHPPIEMPEEIKKFLEGLTATAEAEPENLEAWQNLARARYRAALLDASYYELAIEALDKVEELDPDNLEAVRTRGNIAYDMRRFDEAEKHFKRYLVLKPDDSGVRTDLGTTLLFQENPEGAKKIYREVLADDPDFGQAHVNLGIALHREGKAEEAKEHFARAKELATNDEQRARLDDLIAAAEGRPRPSQAGSAQTAGSAVESNADGAFQKGVDALFTQHRIVGPRVASIDWTGDTTAQVTLRDFPMDKMPPVMRNKFKSSLNEAMTELATSNDVDGALMIELVDGASGSVMDKLDGKEWVGDFDESQYE